MQRTGTTSVGKYLRDFGYKWAGWDADRINEWSVSCLNGDYEKIFRSKDFINADAYEDSPWFYPDFYKILFHRFPDSKFILLRRDANKWFESMKSHSDGNILGYSNVHCKIYRREADYLALIKEDNIKLEIENSLNIKKTLKLEGHDDHYKKVYSLHYQEAVEFFKNHSPHALFFEELEDPNLWQKMGHFLNLKVHEGYKVHVNKSSRL